MKKRLMMAVLLLCMAFSCAAAQTLPSVEVFSPGLIRLSEMLGRGERVQMTAQLSADEMAYARDLSVLQAMLSGTEFAYEGGGTLSRGGDSLRILRDGEELFSFSMARSGQEAELSIGEKTFGLDLSGYEALMAGGDWLAGVPILERVPLADVCAWIEGLVAGSSLPQGYAVTQGFSAERTMSDDGTRLTKINIVGEIARADEAPWQVSGFLRQPAGRTPKDTAEITFTQDEENSLTLTYSSTRKHTVVRKDKAGEAAVDTTLRLDGELAGYGVSVRLTVHLTNAWTLEEENLREKVTVNATLGLTDRAPGRRMQRLNDASIKLRSVLTLDGAQENVLLMGESSSLTAVFDGNTFLSASAEGTIAAGGEYEAPALSGAPQAEPDEIRAAVQDTAVSMARRLYAMLDDQARDKIEAGL